MTKPREKITFLKIRSWIGLSPEAVHYQGELQRFSNCGDKVEFKRILSTSDAKKLNAIRKRQYPGDPHAAFFRAGMEYDGFDTRDELIKLALETYKTHYPESCILILGSASTGDPQLILDAPNQELITEANKIYEEFESFEGYQFRRNEQRAIELNDKWDALLEVVWE